MNKMEFFTTATGRLKLSAPDGRPFMDKDLVFYRNAEYPIASSLDVRGVRIIRNPLSIVASAYFSHIKTHREEGWPLLQEHRDTLKTVSKDVGIALTLQFLEEENFYRETAGPLYAFANWNIFDDNFLTLRMEDMVKSPREFLCKSLEFLGKDPANYRIAPDEKYTFKAITGREMGTVDTSSHLRSGDPNDWKTTLPEYIQDYIKAHYWDYLKSYYPDTLAD